MRAHVTLNQRIDAAERAGVLMKPQSHSERESLVRRVKTGELLQPFPGLFARRRAYEEATPRMRAFTLIRTLARIHPDWTFCSYSAAVMHGLQVPYSCLDIIHRCVAPGKSKRGYPGFIRCHTCVRGACDTVRGVRVTSVEQTVLDCLCQSDFRQGLAIVDSALHCGLTSRAHLEEYFKTHGCRKRGIVQARKTLEFANGLSDNGGESIVRAIVLELGFCAPELQVFVSDPLEPGNPKRVDMAWEREDGSFVFLEVDGKVKYRKRALGGEKTLEEMLTTFSKERLRESHLNLTGATVLRCSLEDARNTEQFFSMLTEARVPRTCI